jgi:hypothetical protein
MAHTQKLPSGESDHTSIYDIRIKGCLSPRWSAWFEDLTISHQANGDTLLTGPVVDQSALHGLLAKVRDLGLTLISVTRREPAQCDSDS